MPDNKKNQVLTSTVTSKEATGKQKQSVIIQDGIGSTLNVNSIPINDIKFDTPFNNNPVPGHTSNVGSALKNAVNQVSNNIGTNVIQSSKDTLEDTTGVQSGVFTKNISDVDDFGLILQSNLIYSRKDMDRYNKFFRFGCIDPYNALTHTKEYLFFTKPDLHICTPKTFKLNPQLENDDFFSELMARYPNVIKQLQKSIEIPGSDNYNPFMVILSNSVSGTLDMPDISARVIDTPATIFGTSIDYRGDAFNAGEKYEFSLEFTDSKYLELYHLFKAMEEYSQLKKFGIVSPPNITDNPKDGDGNVYTYYTEKKVLHDQFSIFKFIVDEDYQDIIYYGLLAGVFTKSTPREAFSDMNPEGGLKYNVQFEAQFVDDMKPYILVQFNDLINTTMKLNKKATWLNVYNGSIGGIDGRLAKTPYVVRQYKDKTPNSEAWIAPNGMAYKYQLRWRLD